MICENELQVNHINSSLMCHPISILMMQVA